MKVYALPNKTRFKVTWEFEKMFVSRLMRYDLDENDKDKKKSFNLLMKDIILKKYPEKYFIKPMEHYANIVLNDSSVLTTQTVPIPIIYTNKIKYFF